MIIFVLLLEIFEEFHRSFSREDELIYQDEKEDQKEHSDEAEYHNPHPHLSRQ
jgi:hypothetical protein